MVDLPALSLQQGCDPAIAISAIVLGKSYDSSSQAVLEVRCPFNMSLSRSGLLKYSTGPPLGNGQLGRYMGNGFSLPRRAQ
jgi:hypothetical protein